MITGAVEGGKYSVEFEDNPKYARLAFGNIDQSHWKRGSLFFRVHEETIFIFRETTLPVGSASGSGLAEL
ncbi:MAG: hypothetical protein JO249_18660 [Acidobacteria bacterium]|nr:hypothetical protein [Acidobacteriota bacterium]